MTRNFWSKWIFIARHSNCAICFTLQRMSDVLIRCHFSSWYSFQKTIHLILEFSCHSAMRSRPLLCPPHSHRSQDGLDTAAHTILRTLHPLLSGQACESAARAHHQ